MSDLIILSSDEFMAKLPPEEQVIYTEFLRLFDLKQAWQLLDEKSTQPYRVEVNGKYYLSTCWKMRGTKIYVRMYDGFVFRDLGREMRGRTDFPLTQLKWHLCPEFLMPYEGRKGGAAA